MQARAEVLIQCVESRLRLQGGTAQGHEFVKKGRPLRAAGDVLLVEVKEQEMEYLELCASDALILHQWR
jgi:hypothetical protein